MTRECRFSVAKPSNPPIYLFGLQPLNFTRLIQILLSLLLIIMSAVQPLKQSTLINSLQKMPSNNNNSKKRTITLISGGTF